MYPNGFGAAVGLNVLPGLTSPLVYDSTRVYLVVRDDFRVVQSGEYLFNRDAQALRITGRFSVAVPTVEKSIRKLTIGGATAVKKTAGSSA